MTGLPNATDPEGPEAVERGYRQATTGVGLVDRSASGKLALVGPEAAAFLTGQVTADVEALAPGEGAYAALLTPKGKIVVDLRILAVAGDSQDEGQDAQPDELLLLCERSGLQALFDHLRRHLIGYQVELEKRTVQRGLLSLLGPRSAALLADVGGALDPAEHAHLATVVDDVEVRLIRTDQGLDLVCDADDVDRLHAALIARGAVPIPEEAAEIVRIETGRPRHGHELDETVMPAEVGIVERAVSFTKGCYVGQETVARLHWRGRPNRHLRGLLLDRPVEPGTVIVEDGRELGRVTSCARSPRLGPIALAIVRREVSPGDTVVVRPAEGGPTTAQVVELPFAAGPPPNHPTTG